ncbi:juvenile hormone acid O-methyltransferase-like [Ixodes scapularis]|uniref:juvenile hormone acid O-methyltransferase-like n=1 Tax=Ixodes scapularis TaxID=6945 RepID=UPI001A9DE5B6|nr:juvenile hormone acid O-methyltransferase-like [Ixodes scapularis]
MANAFSDSNTADNQSLESTILPELYIKANHGQRKFNIQILDSAQMSFDSEPNASQQFLDVGCGTGDFTRQELLPRCQPCRRIVATDVSRAMVEFARENFGHPRITYEVHDIGSDVSGLVQKYGKFDRVYSFFALNWTEDLTAALHNVANLMTDDGECLLVFTARHAMYTVWRRIVEMDRWKSYKAAVERFIPETQNIEHASDLSSYVLRVLEGANLEPRTWKVLTQNTDPGNVEKHIERERSLNPILPVLPEESRTQFKSDVAAVIRKFCTETPAGNSQYIGHNFVVHARKVSK